MRYKHVKEKSDFGANPILLLHGVSVILKTAFHDTKRITEGAATLNRLSPEEERGRAEGGRRHVEATIIAARGQRSDSQDQATDDERSRQENIMILHSTMNTKSVELVDRLLALLKEKKEQSSSEKKSN